MTCGDSLTSCQIENGIPGDCWTSLVGNALGVPFANAAVNGQTSTNWLVRDGVPPSNWPCQEAPSSPSPYDLFLPKAQGKRWAVLMIGAGDSLREVECVAGVGGSWTAPTTADQYEANMRELVRRIWNDVPGLVGIFLATPPYFRHGFAVALGLGAANDRIDGYHARLQAIAASDRRARTLPGLDMRDTFAASDYGADILHPGQVGQNKLAARFQTVLAGKV